MSVTPIQPARLGNTVPARPDFEGAGSSSVSINSDVVPGESVPPRAVQPKLPAGPAEGTIVARLVYDGMPGEGVYEVAKGPRLAPTAAWASMTDAVAAVRQLTAGEDVPAAGIFKRDGRFEAYELRDAVSGSHNFQPYDAQDDNYVARTVAGRGLVSIVNGDAEPDIMSEKEFRRYERYAGGE